MILDRSRSVLIVEDERIVAKDLQQTLAGMGYDAFAIASSAEEAIARASERCPDVVLMDIRIDGEYDGIQTAQLLKQRFDVPIVFLTAHADDATLDRAKRTDPHGYLIKPVRTAELRSAIEVCLYRHEMEKRLRERERWHVQTLESIGDAVVTTDLAGRVTFMNPVAETLTGITAKAALGRSVHEIVQLMDAQGTPHPETPLDKVLREKRGFEMPEAQLLNLATGHRSIIADSAAPVMHGGQTLGAVMVFRDVTEQRRMQKQLDLANHLSSLGTMAAGVAHEVNNPLAVVMANTAFIAEELTEYRASLARTVVSDRTEQRLEDLTQAIADVQAAGERIGRIVADLRAFSKPAAASQGTVDMTQCLAWAVRTTSHEFQQRARLVTHVEEVPHVRGDSARIGQVFINLLLNAAHAIAPGNVEGNEVTVSMRRDERGWIVAEIADTGCGIPAADLGRVFDPFFTTKPMGDGTGLGLAICHGIVTASGGEVHVHSELGKGTRFTVSLPPAPESRELARPAEPTKSRTHGRILVVDDEEMVLRVVKRLLRDHDVTCLQDARAALALIKDGAYFDLIFSDVTMPTMTGIDFYENLLAHDAETAQRVVFLCGGAVTREISVFLESVTNVRLEKPFDVDQLRVLVSELLGRKAA